MAAFTDYEKHDALGLAELVRNGEVTPTELVDEAISRIQRLNPKINAVVTELFNRAREQAAGNLPDGPFRGVPFLFKDLGTDLAGEPMYKGSAIYKKAGFRPDANTTLADRYLSSGVIVVGKSATPEFGLLPSTEPEAFAPTRNPWDPTRTAGGSSGGAGAAIAARMVPMAGGGDGGGSIRIPAAMNGIFGLKPSRGRVPVGPKDPEHWAGFTAEHVLTRSVRDSAAMLDVIAGPALGDWHNLPKPDTSFREEAEKEPGKKLRIAYSTEPYLPGQCHADCQAAVEDAVKLLKELGHEVVEDRPRFDGQAFAHDFLTIVAAWTHNAISDAERETGIRARRSDFETETWLLRKLGAAISAGEYVSALKSLQRGGVLLQRFTQDYDVLLNPTTALPPQPLGFLRAHGAQAVIQQIALALPLGKLMTAKPLMDDAAAETFRFIPWTPVFNVSGQPSMSVPLFWNSEGLPVGTMFTGRFGDEATLFRLAHQLEQARPWKDRKPSLS